MAGDATGDAGGATDWAALLDDGMVSHLDAIASVDEVVRPWGERVLSLRLAGGLALEVLVDRGLDIGAAWWGSVPLAWRSPHLVDPGPGRAWEDRFLGGLLATCGPDNIGPPRGTSGQHGTHHLTPAHAVRWWRERAPGGVEIHVEGSIGHSELYGVRVVVEREIVASTGRPWVEVRDTVRNDGHVPTATPLLYHVNVGAPLLRPGARLEVDADQPVLREPVPPGRDPVTLPDPESNLPAVVAEHRGLRVQDGRARAVLTRTGFDADLVVEWTADTLPRLCTWNFPARGAWVLGIEPTNAPLFGAERDLPHAGAPVLEPAEETRTAVRIGIEPSRDPDRADVLEPSVR